jgi:membrane dipeptidase
MLLFDAHLDLSMNALEWNRDLTQPLTTIRAREAGKTDKPDRGNGVVSLGEMRRGRIGICVATQIARYVAPDSKLPGWSAPEIAWAQTQGQLAWYRAMEEAGQMTQIVDLAGLDRHVALWSNLPDAQSAEIKQQYEHDDPAELPIGYILSLEGADSILTPHHLERAYAQGLRAVGPAHYGPGRYAQGTHATGGLGPRGRELLAEMQRLGIILDATHLCDDSFWEALDHFEGPVWASHQNCRALVPAGRQFSDDQIKELLRRDAVFGGVFDAWMMVPDWTIGKTRPAETGVKIETVIDHMDHICQLAGNARHIGIGSDLDGGFGREQCPQDLDSIADLARLPELLSRRGYSPADIEGVMHGNWLRFLRHAWA